MRRMISVALAACTATALVGAASAAAARTSSASPLSPSADLAVSGFVAGGERNIANYHPVVFVFTLTNKGPDAITSSADLTYTSVRSGTVSDQLCVAPGGSSLDPDSPSCEPGQLAVGQSSHMTLIVQPTAGLAGVPVSVRVCSSNESSIPDPVSTNNCKSLSVLLQ